MLTLPAEIMVVLHHFTPVLSERMWDWARVLLIGAILAPRQRTVCAILRVMGLSQERQFQNYHRVLNRAQWSGLQVSRILLQVLVTTFVGADATLVLGGDETLERRRGANIAGLGCFRDAARSSRHNKVKSMGLRWVSLMLLAKVPWSRRVWALPFLSVLAPNAATHQARGKRHKTSLDWLAQMLNVVQRWLPGRRLVLVVDGALAALKLGRRCASYATPVIYVTRLQWNARLFNPPPPPKPRQAGRKPVVGKRQAKPNQVLSHPETNWQRCEVDWYGGQRRVVEVVSEVALWYTCGVPPLPGRWVIVRDPLSRFQPAILFATDLSVSPAQIVSWFVMRWSMEVTFQEVRTHLGFETQRQWNRLAVERTSPAVLGLFSFVTLLAHHLPPDAVGRVRVTAWYTKPEATFADILAAVRGYLWRQTHFPRAAKTAASLSIPTAVLETWVSLLTYAS